MPTQEQIDALLDTAITNAGGPKRVQVDGNSVDQHSLKDQLDALDRLQEQAGRNRSTLPVRIAKIRPGGTV